ncbi:MAG: aminotransferase class I/II-fold pyridoxal phosphate-dependent enzyme, partial [Nanoarchaeota archaeon]
IISPDLFWGNYRLILENAYGGNIVTFPFFQGNKFNVQGFSEIVRKGKGKKIILLNFPHNPTGYSITVKEAESIVQILTQRAEHGDSFVVLCDDAYGGFVYQKGILKESLFALLADAHPHILAVKIDGATKELFAWGLRIGFITFAGKGITPTPYGVLEQKTVGVIRGSVSNASHLSQSLLLEALHSETYTTERQENFKILQQRFSTVEHILKEKKYAQYFTPLPCNSGYFICIALKQGLDADKIRRTLLHKYSTGVISLGNLLRIAFSGVPEKNLKQLFENIYNACKEHN